MSDKRKYPVHEYHNGSISLWAAKEWGLMWKDILDSRELIMRLAYRDIAVVYRNSILGFLWALINPLLTVGLVAYLISMRVLPIEVTASPYVLFALPNVILWQLFVSVLTSCTISLVNAGSLVTRINFPKEALVFGATGQPMVEFSIKLLLVVGVFSWYGVMPQTGSIFVLLVILQIIMLAVGLGFILSVLNLVVRDVGYIVGIFSMIGMLAAPVLYPPPTTSPFDLVNILNPVSPLLIASQDLLAHGTLEHPDLYLWGSALSLSVFLLGWRVFRSAIVRVSERA
ncbi:MAG: ABC transporter permease [Sedimenticola sp.]